MSNRDEIKSIISKSLETAKDIELVEVYAQVVSCCDCPYWKDCKNEHYCDTYISDKLKRGNHNE